VAKTLEEWRDKHHGAILDKHFTAPSSTFEIISLFFSY